MRPWFESVSDLAMGSDLLRVRRYGVIETRDGELHRVWLRPFPKLVLGIGTQRIGQWRHERMSGDRCLLYYNQPRGHESFLALKYIQSSRDCTFQTARAAVRLLDRIAELKRSDAILCDASNLRISDRLLARWGWEEHAPMPWCRNFIKRLYPRDVAISPAPALELCAASSD
jgi:hypothetical protein